MTRLDKLFKLTENQTTVKTEILAGFTSFTTAAYILAVHPAILAAAGMDRGAVFTATVLAAFIGTLLMALLANYPLVLAPGMGLNAYFAYSVVQNMGYSWQMALAAVFTEGLIFILLSLTGVREAIFNAFPSGLKTAVSAGIGLFITFIGLQNAHLVIGGSGSTLVQLFSLKGYNTYYGVTATFQDAGISVVLTLVGIIITGTLVIKNIRGNILLGIVLTWLLGILCQFMGLYIPNSALGFSSLLPNFSQGLTIPSIQPVFLQLDFSQFFSLEFLMIIFAFLFVDLFDTLGTLMGVSTKAGLLDENGRLPHIKGALLADAVATTAGALLGTSTVTTTVESASGVSAGGRTGLTALTAGLLFLSALFLSPFFLAIPTFATAPALILVGFYMLSAVTNLDFDNYGEALPAFICIIAMPFFSSISEGISMGIIAYTAFHILSGSFHKQKLSLPMIVLTVLFLLKYLLL